MELITVVDHWSVGGRHLFPGNVGKQIYQAAAPVEYCNLLVGNQVDHVVILIVCGMRSRIGIDEALFIPAVHQRDIIGKAFLQVAELHLAILDGPRKISGNGVNLQGHAKVTMQNIFKIHEKLNMNRLIQAIFCIQRCQGCGRWRFLAEPRASRHSVHQKKCKACYQKDRKQCHCKSL